MSDFFGLIRKLGIQRKYIFLLILRSPFDAFRTWMLASLMKATFRCIEEMDANTLVTQCIIYGLICGLLFFYNGTVWSVYAAFAAKTEVLLQKALFRKMMKMSFGNIANHSGGEWITKLNSDIHGAFLLMNGPLNIPHAQVSVVNLVISSVFLCKSSLPLFVATWAFLLPHWFVNNRLVLKHVTKLKEESQKKLAEATATIKPLVTEADSIWVYDAGKLMLKSCEESSRNLMKTNLNMHMRNALSGAILRLFGVGGYLIILLVGYDSIYKGGMLFSDLVYSFQMRGSVLVAMMMLTTCVSNIKANAVCVKRIRDIF